MPLQSIIASNTDAIEQLNTLIRRLDDDQYGVTVCDIAVSTLGCHVRHIIEHYQCFFEGLDKALIDYDARARDPQVECHREVAQQHLALLIEKLNAIEGQEYAGDERLQVLLQTARDQAVVPATQSTLCRELVFLHGHTTHHFAQMALHMRAMGVDIDAQFGMAPSTQRYLQKVQDTSVQSLLA